MSKYWHLSAGKMKVFSLGLLILSVLAVNAHAQSILGSASTFAVLGYAGVTNVTTNGTTKISGDVAGYAPPGPSGASDAITGLTQSANLTSGTLYTAGAPLSPTVFGDAGAAAVTMAGLSSQNLGGVVQLGGATLGAGVYSMGAALLTGTLTLDFTAPGQTIVIDMASTLTTASGPGAASVVLTGVGAPTASVYWVVGSSTQIGTYTSFDGNIISLAGVAMQTGATDPCGSVISLAASVTLDDNAIQTGCNSLTTTTVKGGGLGPGTGTGYTVVPEGGSPLLYLCFSLLPIGTMWAFRFRRSI